MKHVSRTTLFALFSIFAFCNLWGQCPQYNGYTAYSQSHIDLFKTNFPNCIELQGDLSIYGQDIIDLSGFSNLQKINGRLSIYNCPQLKNLIGFNDLKEISKELRIFNCDSLESFQGMETLETVGTTLEIKDLPRPKNLVGLNGLLRVEGNIYIANNDSLQSLNGIQAVPYFKNLSIENCPTFTDFSGIIGLDPQIGKLTLNNLPSLTSFQGLHNLRYVPHLHLTGALFFNDLYALSYFDSLGSLSLQYTTLNDLTGLNGIQKLGSLNLLNNNHLKSLSGLDSLRRLQDHLIISSCDSLSNLAELSSLQYIGGNMEITFNPKLENFEGLNSLDSVMGQIYVASNTQLRNFKGMESLTYLHDKLYVRKNDSLTDFEGLTNLWTIGKSLKIEQCRSLKNFSGLNSLQSIIGSLYLKENISLKNCSGLQNLRYVWGDIHVEKNQVFEDFLGLEKVESPIQKLYVLKNPSLINFEGIEKLDTTRGDIYIYDNDNLTNLKGLESINYVGNNLSIAYNDKLTDVKDINVRYISNDFAINNNASLKDLIGFDSLEFIGGDFDPYPGGQSFRRIIGFNNLKTIIGIFDIQYIQDLLIISGFNSIESVGGINISNNNSLEKFVGFGSMHLVHGPISINNNPKLVQITNFQNLSSCGSIGIYNNPELLKIPTFNQLDSFTIQPTANYSQGGLGISGNSKISAIQGFNRLKKAISIAISNNENLQQISGFAAIQSTGLYIYNNPKLVDIDAFSGIHSANGITLQKLGLTHIPAFSNLENNTSKLEIIEMDSLQQISGFGSLKKIGRDFIVRDNPLLKSLPNFDSLSSISQYINIVNNPLLQNIPTFPKLTYSQKIILDGIGGVVELSGFSALKLAGDITVNNCNSLHSIAGFSSLETSNKLIISNNPEMVHLGGFPNLEYTKNLEIKDNGNLLTSQAFPKFNEVVEFYLENNPMLSDLKMASALHSIRNFTINNCDGLTTLADLNDSLIIDHNVIIRYNDNLGHCAVLPICNKIGNFGPWFVFTNNGQGCNSSDEIETICAENLSTFVGNVYADIGCDSSFTPNTDSYIPYHIVRNELTGLPFVMTNMNGNFRRFVQPGNSILVAVDSLPLFSSKSEAYSFQTDSIPRTYPNQSLRLCPDTAFHNITLTVTAYGPPRPGFEQLYKICVKNRGVFSESASVTLDFLQPTNHLIEILNADGGLVDGHRIIWQTNGIPIFGQECFSLRVRLNPAAALGDWVRVSAYAETNPLVAETNLDDNVVRLVQTIVGSYDPNDKLSDSPKVTKSPLDSIGRIEYTIRFQNTGTYPAEFVEIYDTLEPYLNMQSIKMIDASHDYTLAFPEENVLFWRFEDINLVDSATDAIASQGFVRFSIAIEKNMPLYETAHNAVAIYFDFNEAIFTDTAKVTACPPLEVGLLAVKASCGLPNGVGVAQVQQVGNFTYEWSNGMSGTEIHDVPSGFYAITVTENIAACATIGYVEIGEVPPPLIQLNHIDSITCAGDFGAFSVSVSGGTQPFQFEWSNGATTDALENLTGGTYHLLLQDALGCTDSSFSVHLNNPAALEIHGFIENQTSSINPDGAITPFILGGVPPYQFEWQNGATDSILTGLAAGEYSLKITDANGCEKIHNFTVHLLTSTETLNNSGHFSVYPNPTSDKIYIKNNINQNKSYNLMLFDGLQRMLLNRNNLTFTEESVDLENLPIGTYTLYIQTEQQIYTYNIIKTE